MPPVGFEPTISAGERPQTYALDRAVPESGKIKQSDYVILKMKVKNFDKSQCSRLVVAENLC
jgi:hypothetical protein